MYKIKRHIEIVRSPLTGFSSMSNASANALRNMLRKVYTRVDISNIASQQDLDRLVLSQPDVVFLGMKRLPTPKGIVWLADFLDSNQIPYTGSPKSAHMLELDKSLAKQRISEAGLKTSPFVVIKNGQKITENTIPFSYPVFIKPTDRGGGAGVDDQSIAHNLAELQTKVHSISAAHNSDSLVEKFLAGREFSVAVLRQAASSDFMTMPIELIAPANSKGYRVLSAAVKSADTERFVAVTDQSLHDMLSQLALDAFHALGARDYGRIDIRLDSQGVPHFLEANLIPSVLKDYGNFLKACMLNKGITYKEAILRVIDLAFERASETQPVHTPHPVQLMTETLHA